MAFFRKTFPRAVAAAALILAVALPAADAPFAPEVQQRLDLLKTGYETFVLNNTTIPYEAGVKALNERVKPTLERESAAAAQRTDLDTLVRIKADLERLGEGELLTAVEEAPPAPLKHAYSAYKLELDRLTSIQKASLADAKRRYDKGLELVQKELTKEQDVTAALLVKELREALVDAPVPTVAAATDKSAAPGENLLSNGSFEKGLTMWEMTSWNREVESKMVMDKKVLFHDKATLRVTNPALNDAHIAQKVKVKPNTRYLISGFIKAQDIKDAMGNTAGIPGVKVQGGGCLNVTLGNERYNTVGFVTTDAWTEVSREFKTKDVTELVFECRLGYFSYPVSGTAWFAEISLTEVKDAAPQAAATQGAVPLPLRWTYHVTEKPDGSVGVVYGEMHFKPDGTVLMLDRGKDKTPKPGQWKSNKKGDKITIKMDYLKGDEGVWQMEVKGATATMDCPGVSRRYMRVKEP